MSYMKEHLMEKQEALVKQASLVGGLSEGLIWEVIDSVAYLNPTSEGPLGDTEEICSIAKLGETRIISEFEFLTGTAVDETSFSDFSEEHKFDSKNDMLCDIIYSIRELRREQ